MTPPIRQLYDQLTDELHTIRSENYSRLKEISLSIRACQDTLQGLRLFIDSHPLIDNAAEIHFFKNVKPQFYAHFIFYVKVLQTELNRPVGTDKDQINYYEEQLLRIKLFFDSRQDLYLYYRSDATHLDEMYFVRGQHDVQLIPDDLALTIDPHFCTAQSYQLAKLLANEKLKVYFDKAIADIQKSGSTELLPDTLAATLEWTGPKVALVELVYALQDSGVLNNGQADIKKIVETFETYFNVKLGNVYNSFQEMRLRKKNRSVFLDELKERLIKRMDEADER